MKESYERRDGYEYVTSRITHEAGHILVVVRCHWREEWKNNSLLLWLRILKELGSTGESLL